MAADTAVKAGAALLDGPLRTGRWRVVLTWLKGQLSQAGSDGGLSPSRRDESHGSRVRLLSGRQCGVPLVVSLGVVEGCVELGHRQGDVPDRTDPNGGGRH